MAAKAGVWIDHKQAIVVLMTDAGQKTKKKHGHHQDDKWDVQLLTHLLTSCYITDT